jgi:hypothetical protein
VGLLRHDRQGDVHAFGHHATEPRRSAPVTGRLLRVWNVRITTEAWLLSRQLRCPYGPRRTRLATAGGGLPRQGEGVAVEEGLVGAGPPGGDSAGQRRSVRVVLGQVRPQGWRDCRAD